MGVMNDLPPVAELDAAQVDADLELSLPPQTVQVLPSAPRDEELGSYEHREVALLSGVSAISVACLVVSQARFATLSPWLLLVLPALTFTVAYYLVSLFITLRSRNFDLAAHRSLVEAWAPPTYPTVDVLLPICNEGLDVLANSWRHVAGLVEGYRGDVEVYVLDDGDNPAASALAASYGFRYMVRPNRGWLKKAGNLQHGYRNSSGEFLVIFDADFCPRSDFLDQLLPHADADPRVGIVQSPQYFRASKAQTLMERGASAVQELFYRVVQVSRDAHGGAICVGSCALYRRAALDSIGGTALIEHSEDVHTGFAITCVGWRLKYLPVPLATGLCPANPDAFLTQQYRWCAGSMSLLTSRRFWTSKVPLRTRLCYLSGFCYYLHTAVFVVVTPAIPLLLIAIEPGHVKLANYVWILPSTIYALVVFPLWNRIRYGPSALMAKYLYGWAHVFAVLDTLRGSLSSWQVTGAGAAGSRRDTRRIWWAIRIWGGVSTAAWLGGALWRAVQYGEKNWMLMEFAGSVYAGTMAMALWARRTSLAASRPGSRPTSAMAA